MHYEETSWIRMLDMLGECLVESQILIESCVY